MVSRERVVPWAIDACPFLGPLSCAAHGENDDDGPVLVVTPWGGGGLGGVALPRLRLAIMKTTYTSHGTRVSWDPLLRPPFLFEQWTRKTLEIRCLALNVLLLCGALNLPLAYSVQIILYYVRTCFQSKTDNLKSKSFTALNVEFCLNCSEITSRNGCDHKKKNDTAKIKNLETVRVKQFYQSDIYLSFLNNNGVFGLCWMQCTQNNFTPSGKAGPALLKSRVVGADVEEKKHHNSSRKPYRGWPQSPDSPPGGTTLG